MRSNKKIDLGAIDCDSLSTSGALSCNSLAVGGQLLPVI